MRRILPLALLVAVGALPSQVSATIVYDSFAAVVDADYFWEAFRQPFNSFSTGSSDAELTDVWFRLLLTGDPVGSVDFGLYYDNAGSPGDLYAPLGSVNDSDIVAAPAWEEVHFTPTPITLEVDTRYWIGMTTVNDSGVAWLHPLMGTFDGLTGVEGEYNGQGSDGFFSENAPDEGSPLQMRVNIEPVPEPSVVLLMGLGLALLVRRRAAAR